MRFRGGSVTGMERPLRCRGVGARLLEGGTGRWRPYRPGNKVALCQNLHKGLVLAPHRKHEPLLGLVCPSREVECLSNSAHCRCSVNAADISVG